MSRRRVPLSLSDKVKVFLWPRKGFSRLYSYLMQRVLRMPGSAYSLASGFACGVAVSFTPLIGFHLLLAFALAYFVRGNMATALLPIALSVAEGVYDLVTFGLSLSGVGSTITTTATETATLLGTGITAGLDSAIASVAVKEGSDFVINKTIEKTATKIAKKTVEKATEKTIKKTTEKAVKKKLSKTIAKNLTKIFAKYGLKSIFIMISFILTLVTAILYYLFHISIIDEYL